MNKENKTGQRELTEDIHFMRLVIDKTCRKIDPGWATMITWGLIIIVGFPLLYFLKINKLDNWLWRIQWLMVVAGFSISAYFALNAILRERKLPVASYRR